MAKRKKLTIKELFSHIDFDWKHLLYPIPVDIQEMTISEVKHAKRYNIALWCISGILALTALLCSYPDIEQMITGLIIILALFIAFCAIMQNARWRKSKAGRKELPAIDSFRVCFLDSDFYKRVDSFIVESHKREYPMGSAECHALLDYVLQHPSSLIPGMSLNRLSYFVIKDYAPTGLITFSTERAVAKAMITAADRERIVKYFSK